MILLKLFFTFFKIGLFTFGGGYAMIPLIQSEVYSHGWMSPEDLINFIAISESTPGTFAINISTYIGKITGGFSGATAASTALVLPSFIIVLIVAKFYDKFKKSPYVDGAMTGLRPAAIGLIGSAFISILKTVISNSAPDYTTLLAVGLFAFLFFLQLKKLHPIFIILISAVCGIVIGIIFQVPVNLCNSFSFIKMILNTFYLLIVLVSFA